MKLSDFKLSSQLAFGFGAIIVITLFLGVLATFNMLGASRSADAMVKKYIPSVNIVSEVERNALQTMYAMRGFAFTMQQEYYSEMEQNLAEVKKYLAEGNALANNQKLEVLKKELDAASINVTEYERLARQTREVILAMDKLVADMNSAAADFINYSADFAEEEHKHIRRVAGNSGQVLQSEQKLHIIYDIRGQGNELRISNFRAQALRDPVQLQEAIKQFNITREVRALRDLSNRPGETEVVNRLEAAATKYVNAMNDYLTAWLERERLNVERNNTAQKVLTSAYDTAEFELNTTTDLATSMNNSLASSSMMVLFGLLVAVVLAFIFAWIITRSIVSGISSGVSIAQVISTGDLTKEIDNTFLERKDEIGMLAKALQNMVTKLKEVISSVVSGSDNIASASQQMSSTAQEMSQGGTEQASSAEEVSSSMEEMAANIQQNTDNAQQTEKIARQAELGIMESSKASEQAMTAMKDIAEKISIIGEISRQTNILALNAAVEAARAGEHGKGFAVVAAEVRKLAERSQVAAAEIDKLSRFGVNISEEAGKKLAAIVPEIQKTARLVQEIAAASIEQNSGSEQVNSAIQQLNQVTQQNAAASEEMATSSEELASQADQLLEIVSYFKLDQQSSTRKTTAFKPVKVNKTAPAPAPTSFKSVQGKSKGIKLKLGSDSHDDHYESF
jgi:methyl-accepting chemotaxis protein